MLRRVLVTSLVVGAAMLGSSPAHAGHVSRFSPQVLNSVTHVRLGLESNTSAPSCTLGVKGDIDDVYGNIIPPEDIYYTLLRQSDCPTCPQNLPISLSAAHMTMFFPVSPCTLSVAVAIIGAKGSDTCPQPDLGNVLFDPIKFDLLAPPDGGFAEFAIPFPPGCNMFRKAFLSVDFVADGRGCTDADRPQIATIFDCSPCTNFNLFTDFVEDMCDTNNPALGNLLMAVDVGACGVLSAPRLSVSNGIELDPAFPNPSHGSVTIDFTLPRRDDASIKVYDIAGALVRTLQVGKFEAGEHRVPWDRRTDSGLEARPGTYYYELRSGGVRLARRVVMLR